MDKGQSPIFLKFRRQLSWRRAVIARIDEREILLAQQNVRLIKRRRRYTAKNNGKGRPAKAPPQLSKTDIRARLMARVEAEVLEKMLGCPPQTVLIDWIDWHCEHWNHANADIARQKLKSLRHQFTPQTPSPNVERVWTIEQGRAFLINLRTHQNERLRPFVQRPAKEDWDKALEDRERARKQVIEALLRNSNLSNLRRVAVHCVLLQTSCEPEEGVHDPKAYQADWRGQVDWLLAQIKAVFVEGVR